MILNKNIHEKISTDDEFEKIINYVGRRSAARLGKGFMTRPFANFGPGFGS